MHYGIGVGPLYVGRSTRTKIKDNNTGDLRLGWAGWLIAVPLLVVGLVWVAYGLTPALVLAAVWIAALATPALLITYLVSGKNKKGRKR